MSIPIPSDKGTCLITGASAGIGTEFARQMAERGYNVTLAARRIDRLNDLATEIESAHNVRAVAVACDVTNPEQRRELLDSIEARGDVVDVLINNAGIGTDGPFWERHTDEQLAQIEINVLALTALTHMVLPGNDRARPWCGVERRIDRRLPADSAPGGLRGDEGLRLVVLAGDQQGALRHWC